MSRLIALARQLQHARTLVETSTQARHLECEQKGQSRPRPGQEYFKCSNLFKSFPSTRYIRVSISIELAHLISNRVECQDISRLKQIDSGSRLRRTARIESNRNALP